MPELPMNKHLQRYYSGKKPSTQSLDRLVALAESTTLTTSSLPATPRPRLATSSLLAVAALVLLLIGSGLFLSQRPPHHDLNWLVAKEIAVNHNKHLAIEFPTGSYRELNQLMDKLDFSSVISARLKDGQYRLLGGRYCSIQGQMALQLKLQDRAGNLHTLYQTPISKTLAAIPESVQSIDGLRLSLWREAGLFFGLASPQSAQTETRTTAE